MKTSSLFRRLQCFCSLLAFGASLSGCSWLDSLKQEEPNPTFPGWSQRMSGSAREPQEKTAKQDPKSRSLFFDDRSQEIEKSLNR
ncbi:MAG: hypothetical protein IAF94_11820 [Pirellulaceae bacterium]|nr:hypothetical protein [Pirellulaceae bacterium]